MNSNRTKSGPLENPHVDVKTKLALLWSTLMFLYIYADYFLLMTPGAIEKTMNLESPLIPTTVTPTLLIGSSILLIVPTLMIFLSVFLRPGVNRWLNILVCVPYAIISILIIVSSTGNEWLTFYALYNAVELVVFVMIFWQAWSWPKTVGS